MLTPITGAQGDRRAALLLSVFMLLAGAVLQPVAAQDPSADLAITKQADRSRVKIGRTVTYTIGLKNLGPDTVTGLRFGDSVPDALNLVSFGCWGGVVDGSSSFCLVDELEPGASASATLVATPIPNLAPGEERIHNTAFVEFLETPIHDPNPSNNQASVTVRVVGKRPH